MNAKAQKVEIEIKAGLYPNRPMPTPLYAKE